MQFMARERMTLEAFIPGFDAELAATPLPELEARDGDTIARFKSTAGPGLLVPKTHRGLGATPLEALRVQRAIGSRSPSLAVASTMHHFSTATLVELWERDKGLESMLLQAIAKQHLLLASGFAEGVTAQGVLKPTMKATRRNGKVVISGRKRPCSLAQAMDIITASLVIEGEDSRGDEFGVALISSTLPGIEVAPFWSAPVLTGAQSESVTLTDVAIEEDLVITMGSADAPVLDAIQVAGFLWFELLISASYLGIASALAERVLEQQRGEPGTSVSALAELEAAMAGLEAVALHMNDSELPRSELLQTALLCRYSAQDAISRSVATAVELLGGMAFIGSSDVTYLAAASRALAFHPPGRTKTAASLLASLRGAELELA
jgi:alkylation response protein AidB-like acyl-CoA dehydrogenase